ncbi:MAG: TetR/AcrR family transcriptional regulator [Actinomycetia bacterium]|nr:TetR/AcrR family transcriptional regulator [Actinomycetes bacterium]MCP4961695.1 TetR/AcrR family transcriptional regulator [Actinomycetes bacterium]
MARVDEVTKAQHRQRLLEAAAAEFAAKGLEGARVDDISLAAGLAKGTIYNYFDSKLAVFGAVVEEWARRTGEARIVEPDDASIRDQLLGFVRGDVAVIAEMEEFARAAVREVLTMPPDVVAGILPAWEPIDAELEAIVERAQGRGELRSDRPALELTRMFLTLVNGLVMEHWFPGSSIVLADIPELAVDYFLDGALPR